MAAKGLNRGWPAKLKAMAEMLFERDQQAFPGRWLYLSWMQDARKWKKGGTGKGKGAEGSLKYPHSPAIGPLA